MVSECLMKNGLAERLIALRALADNPVAFAEKRHEILQDFLGTIEPERLDSVHMLQSQIDMQTAMTLHPDRMTHLLLGMLEEHVEAIEGIMLTACKDAST